MPESSWRTASPGDTLLGHIRPLCTWFAIRLMLTLILLHNWSTLTINFVLTYPQADVENETYIKLPPRINFGPNISRITHVLKVLKNIYRLKQVECVWNKHLHQGLIQLNLCSQNVTCVSIIEAMWSWASI